MASKIQANDAKNNDLNLTPLIDAVFLLLDNNREKTEQRKQFVV